MTDPIRMREVLHCRAFPEKLRVGNDSKVWESPARAAPRQPQAETLPPRSHRNGALCDMPRAGSWPSRSPGRQPPRDAGRRFRPLPGASRQL